MLKVGTREEFDVQTASFMMWATHLLGKNRARNVNFVDSMCYALILELRGA